MNNPQHTPGPWIVEQRNHMMRVVRRIGDPGDPAFTYRHITRPWPEERSGAKRGTSPSWYGWNNTDEANARLIAAAPELLEALQTLVRRIERDNLHTTQGVSISKALQVIAKATE